MIRRRLRAILNYRPNFKGFIKLILSLIIYLLIFIILVPINMLRVLDRYYGYNIYDDVSKVPENRIAIVFGAGLVSYGEEPSSVLKDRIDTAIELYKLGKIEKIIMSGDNSVKEYNEPEVMLDYAKKNGVSSFDLQGDFAGKRTYDTCYRAKYIFGVEKAVLITQDFHLTRALYICNNLGIESIGFKADKNEYVDIITYTYRDMIATLLAYYDLYIMPPDDVILGEPIIF